MYIAGLAEPLALVIDQKMAARRISHEPGSRSQSRHKANAVKWKLGWNTTADGERFYFIPTPSAGLWAHPSRLKSSV
jgi:hypothetical protein